MLRYVPGMGNGGNSAFVTLKSVNAFYPGDRVSGVLHLDIATAIECTGINLKLSGKEYVHWTEQRSSGSGKHRRTHTVHFNGVRQLFNFVLPIQEFRQAGFAGQYEFPFEFTLPEGIPGTFNFMQGSVTGLINYKLKGFCGVAGFLKSNIKHTLALNVLSRPMSMPQRMLGHTTGEVTVCCCFNKGVVDIKFFTASDTYLQGQDIVVMASINNTTSVPVKGIVIELVSEVQLISTVKERNVESIVASIEHAGLAPGEVFSNKPLQIRVPHDSLQQVSGSIVRHRYLIRVRARVAWASDPQASVPVGLFSAYIPNGQPADGEAAGKTVPQNWTPQQAPTIRIILPQTANISAQPLPTFTAYGNVQPLDARPVNGPAAALPPPQYAMAGQLDTQSVGIAVQAPVTVKDLA